MGKGPAFTNSPIAAVCEEYMRRAALENPVLHSTKRKVSGLYVNGDVLLNLTHKEQVALMRELESLSASPLALPRLDEDSESQAAWSKRYQSAECAICTEEWKAGDRVVLTQPCSHVLHLRCLDSWAIKCFELGTDAVSCPVCRQTVQTMRHFACGDKPVSEETGKNKKKEG